MADFIVRIHHRNATAVGKGWNVTVAMRAAVTNYMRFDHATAMDHALCLSMVRKLRECKQGFTGLDTMRLDFGKSFVKLERV